MFRVALAGIRSQRPRSARTGAVLLLLLLSLGVLLSILAMTINVGLLCATQARMNAAVESAALAGAADLMDPVLALRATDRQRTAADLLVLLAATEQRMAASRQNAVRFAAACGTCVRTAGNGGTANTEAAVENDAVATDDVTFGWVADPTTRASPLLPHNGSGPVNAIEVRAERSCRTGDRIALWFGRLLGLQMADMNTMARAAVDQRVYGFRPAKNLNVPMVPLALLVPAGGASGEVLSATVRERVNGDDRYAVDARTGRVTSGPDGIAEVMVRLGDEQETNGEDGCISAALFFLAASEANDDVWGRQAREGFSAEDLAPRGGRFAIGSETPLIIGLHTHPETLELSQMREVLLAIRGQRRIWPLVQSDGLCGAVVGFAAGCLVDCRSEEHGNLLLVWQPASVLTPTALTGGGAAANRWIGKLLLIR